MRVGGIVSVTQDNHRNWSEGVFRCLKATHDCGYYHCDIRQANILMFDKTNFQLIDYDMAVPTASPLVRFSEGGTSI